MSAVPLRNNKATAEAVRSITVLGATGSIGDSTMDLLRGAPERYRIEALTGRDVRKPDDAFELQLALRLRTTPR